MLQGLQTLLQEFMPDKSKPEQSLPKERKKRKQNNDLAGALNVLLHRHSDNPKKREQKDFLAALQRLVTAAVDGKISLDERPQAKSPEKAQNVGKAKNETVNQMLQKTKSYADMARQKPVPRHSDKPVVRAPQYKLWKTVEKRNLGKRWMPKSGNDSRKCRSDQLDELQLLCKTHELKPSTYVFLPDDATPPVHAKQEWIQIQYPKKGPELRKLYVVPLCGEMPDLPTRAVKKVATPTTESESGVLRITIPKSYCRNWNSLQSKPANYVRGVVREADLRQNIIGMLKLSRVGT